MRISLPFRVMLVLWVFAAFVRTAPAQSPWVLSGDGSRTEAPLGFTQEGKSPYVVGHPGLGQTTTILTAELVLPTPGASLQITFADPLQIAAEAKIAADAQAAAKKAGLPDVAKKDDDAKPAPLAALSRLTLAKEGKSISFGRGTLVITGEPTDPIPVFIAVGKRSVQAYIGSQEEFRERQPGQAVPAYFALDRGAKLQNVKVQQIADGGMLPMVTFGRQANRAVSGPTTKPVALDTSSLPHGPTTINNVPFYFPEGEKIAMDVATSMSGLKDPYPNGNFFTQASLVQNGRVYLSVPGDQYSALHLVAFSAGRPEHVQRMTVRVGFYGKRSNILEEVVVNVPAISGTSPDAARPPVPVKLADGKTGYLHHIRVPLEKTANVKEFRAFTVEFTRDMNTHINPPDPSSYGQIPVGHPSDVVIMAATLEPSPIMMSYTTGEGGNVFYDTQKVQFKVSLTNRSGKPSDVRAYATATGPGTGEEVGIEPKTRTVDQAVRLNVGETKEVVLDVTPGKRGWYACKVGAESNGVTLQQRDTTFAVLAPDTRLAMEDSPFGVWEFWFPHTVSRSPNHVDVLASLIQKGGWRWTYGGSPMERGTVEADSKALFKRLREQYKITWNISNTYKNYQEAEGWFDQDEFDQNVPESVRKRMEIAEPSFKVLHESRSSAAIVRRFSEYLGGKPYDMPAAEKERLDKQFENVKKYTAALKKVDPLIKIVLINDYPAVANEFMARKLPAENFDVIGLEGAMFLRSPERQPDWMSLLGQIRQTKLMMQKHGYDKPIWTTEALYHPTEAGGLSLHQQGVISVREAMIALQIGVQRMAAAGLIKDPSSDYHWSNWGSGGFCFRDPEINPKPSYAMYAWLTQVLDQAKPAGHVATPNTSLHVVRFKKPDGSEVYSVWTAKGVQAVELKINGKATAYDVYGNVLPTDGTKLTASPTPVYLVGTTVGSVSAATPIEQKIDAGQVVIDFDKPDQLKTGGSHAVLDKTWETPRLKGEFESSFVTEDGASAMKVTLKPDQDDRKLLPRYVEYDLATPITFDGRPDRFALRVKGNSGWGRIMFEVVDAKGRVFTSSGNLYSGATNSADSLGESFISFEGWHTITFPVVGMYPGVDQQAVKPFNYNWWPTNTPEELAIGPRNDAAKESHEDAVEAYEKAVAAWEVAIKDWEEAAEKAKAAGKPAPKKPAKPAEPRFRQVQYMGQVPVSYPIKLTKLLIDMRPSILYLDEEVPVRDPSIYLDNLRVIAPPDGQ